MISFVFIFGWGLPFSCRNQDLKFYHGAEKFVEAASLFASVRIRFFNEVIDRLLILVSDLALVLVDPVSTCFNRIW